VKIDKIVFCTSEEFSPFWNIQSFLWKEKLGIEPVVLLWGKVENTTMSDKYGDIIEMEYDSELLPSFQMTWSKFYHTSTEPDTTWIVGDMDLIPLSAKYFKEAISTVDPGAYTHLAYGIIPRQLGVGDDVFIKNGGYANSPEGVDVPAYYHVAKGKTFTKALGLEECSFNEQVRRVIADGRFGMGPVSGRTREQVASEYSFLPMSDEDKFYWVSDENYSSYRIYNSWKKGVIDFVPRITPVGWHLRGSPESSSADRVDRACSQPGGPYIYGKEKANAGQYIDVHCHRPYHVQEDALRELLRDAWGEGLEGV